MSEWLESARELYVVIKDSKENVYCICYENVGGIYVILDTIEHSQARGRQSHNSIT